MGTIISGKNARRVNFGKDRYGPVAGGVELAEFSTLRISAVVPESVLRLSILNGIVNPLIRGL